MTDKANKRKLRKLFILFVIIFITAVVLVVETYAWFVGISTVNVSNFDVTITGAQGLDLSLNGSQWTNASTPLSISGSDLLSTSSTYASPNKGYSGSGNKWPTSGLKPISSAGVIASNGRLELFEKSSLSATGGGYRLVSSKISNSSTEQDGYIAFDLFIRNGTEDVFDPDNYATDGAENIYMTNTSAVIKNGNKDGAQNSVRVGFFMIAGMKSYNAPVSDIQSLSCSTTNSDTKQKLCPQNGADQELYWNIWEPNYNKHTDASKQYFNNICKTRNGDNSYTSTTCTGFQSSGTDADIKTYAVYQSTGASNNIDIYDGINGWTSNVRTTADGYENVSPPTNYLKEMKTYHTPANATSYTAENQIFKLAGNSITKVRVYIWLEGQDIDNYDAITGSTVQINFGLTKNRFNIS